MTVRIRFRGGQRAGELLEFGEAHDVVLIGRDPARCQVVFADERVSREHCLLRRSLGGYTLEVQRGNVVLVDGRVAHDRQMLDGLCELQLGRGGPSVVVESETGGALAPTAGAPARRAGTHTLIERLRSGERRVVTGLVLTVLVLASVAAWAWTAIGEVSDRVEVTRTEIRSMAASERSQLMEGLGKLSLSADDRNRLETVVERARPLVGIVMVGNAGQDPSLATPLATAWIGARDAFVSNAHVADDFSQLKPGQTMFVRGQGGHPVDVPITGVTPHPGYASFRKLREQYAPSGPEEQGELSFVWAADVALLHAKADDVARMSEGPPLSLASRDDLLHLAAGSPVLTIGYPRDNLVRDGGDLTSPVPETELGNVTSVTDVFLAAALRPEDALLVHDSLGTARGASGSPILDREGHVVGVRSAGNFVRIEVPVPRGDPSTASGSGELLVPAGVANFAQRADFVRELIDGTAEAAQVPRDAAWREAFDRLRVRGNTWLMEQEPAAFAEWLAREDRSAIGVEEVQRGTGTLTGSGIDDGARLHLTVPRSGYYSVLAVPGGPVDLDARATQGGVVKFNDQLAAHHVAMRFPVTEGSPVDVVVWCEHSDAGAASFDFVVFRDRK